jgi:NADPH:quinone reductase-like Zn-dependent oxidoreductase/short-subunit dehydrogenase/acyl carrier protein
VSSLLHSLAWEHALAEQGFEDIETFFEPAREDLTEGSYLLLAKRPLKESLPVPEPAAATWLLLWDAHGPSRRLGDHLRRRLESQGQRVAVAIAGSEHTGEDLLAFDPHNPESVRGVLTAARRALGRIDHVAYLVLSGEDPQAMVGDGDGLESRCCTGLLHLVQALEDRSAGQPRLWLVTSGGALISRVPGGRKANPLQASLWSFGRVVMNEYPALLCTLIDVACDPDSPDMARRLETELLRPDGEREIVLAPQTRHTLQMGRVDPLAPSTASGTTPRFRLDFLVPGQLRNLVWLPQPERPLAEDEIEVRPVAAGLNFRDIMYTMGLLPDEAVENGFTGANLGLEFAGIVTRVGARVRELSAGDAVMGFGSACFASHIVTKAYAVTPKPPEWSFEAAATVPTVFFTVYYALVHLADLQPGERVLIHGAAGGVGLAALQLARHLGAEVFATAGSEEKRDFVRLLGADHVLDSRSLAFVDQILDRTHGEGVDVVLNSLAGEAIRRNLRVLKPFGRFLELGKRDFFENTAIGLRPFKNNISYFGIDVDQLLIARPALAVRLFREVMALFRDGTLFPLPYCAIPAERVADAFRILQQARHIGKVVVTLDKARIHVDEPRPLGPPVRFKKDATYLVTGGLSGFGLESARWLAEHGAGHLVLLGRRGRQTPRVTAAVRELETRGASVKVVACDVADCAALQSVLATIQGDLPPLRGILHAAMVLDDALITNLDAERFRKVLAPKLLGARHLHNLTLGIPLDHFILYSSVTTFIGNPGQANYVAANAYLEGLAILRRSLGLPVTCIGWGPIGDAGYLTRNKAVKDSLTALLGAAPLTATSALATLESLLASDSDTLAVADFDWHTLARLLPSAEGPRFTRLRREAGKAADADEHGEDFCALIRGKSPEEVRSIVHTLVTQEVAQTLGIGIDRIDSARSLHDLGMDSLMGVELALGLEKRFGLQLPAMLLSERPTTERVSARIVEKIMRTPEQGDADEESRLDTLVDTLAAQHGEVLSTEEVVQTVAEIHEYAKTGTRLVP